MNGNDASFKKPTIGINNREWVYTELNSKLSKSFASWKAIENDLSLVIDSLNFLISKSGKNKYSIKQHDQSYSENQVIKFSVYRSAAVTYARAFVKAEGRNTKLDKNIFKNKKLKATHHDLMNQRHNLHAHAGHSKYYTISPIVAFNPKDKKNYKLSTIAWSVQSETEDELNNYLEVVKFALEHVQKKSQQCGDKLLIDEIRPNVDNLFSKATNSDK